MALQMILCLETNKAAATDFLYIRETINRFYALDNKIRITPVYMNSKSRYKSNEVVKNIKRNMNAFTIGESKVIYCIDTDSYENDIVQSKELDEVKDYCQKNGYELIWFCHDVEEVYIGSKVSANKKVAVANDFRRKKLIQNISEENMSSKRIAVRRSNILLIMDKYMRRK